MKALFEGLPPWALVMWRVLAVLALPIGVIAAFATVSAFVSGWGSDHGIFYMRTEATLISCLPLMIVVTISLFMRWSGSGKAAARLVGFSLAALAIFVGAAATLETINTRPIVAATDTFKVPPALTREVGTNGDRFSAAPSGFVPCIDIMAEGCPNIRRTWNAPAGQDLTAAELQDILDASGWPQVKIRTGECDLSDKKNGRFPSCLAEGPVGGYKATAQIVKIHNWELRLYVRPSTNVR